MSNSARQSVEPVPEMHCVAWMGNMVVLLRTWVGGLITPMARNQVRAEGTFVEDFWET